MAEPADLTVIIATSGRWEVLGRTLAGLAAQTVSGFAVLVVVDGLQHPVPAGLEATAVGGHKVRWVAQERLGPAAARNLGMAVSDAPLVLFLGDDQIPEPGLVAAHLRRHTEAPDSTTAVLGRVRWHPEVAGGRINRWLDWSGTQFDYAQLEREVADGATEAGFGRFYSANVSLKRALFGAAGGFDPGFGFAYEDLDFGYRASQAGMTLAYEPGALALHHHAYTLADLERRFEHVGEGEARMATLHPWFDPWYAARLKRHGTAKPAASLWAQIHDRVPQSLERIWWPVHTRADRFYHQRLAPAFWRGWHRTLDRGELEAYLGDAFDEPSLWGHEALVEQEVAAVGDEQAFYRGSHAYLYDLTAFAMAGTKDPYRETLAGLVGPGARLLDYGAGIGADGLRLIEAGYRVEFADFDNPSLAYLRWRLAHRGLEAPVHDLDAPGGPPGGFDLAYAFDVLEHVEDPWAFLDALESRAAVVLVNVLEPSAGDISIHHDLPVAEIIAHARACGLLTHRRLHGRVHLLAYRGRG